MRKLTFAFAVSLGVVATTSSTVLAQPADAAEADRLFAEAKALAEAGSYGDACPKLERSLALDPAIGTEFNLADCYEHVSRNASAYRHYRSVEKAAHVAGKAERETAARGRIAALEPRLAWLKLAPAPGTALATLTVDGEAVPPSSATDSTKGLAIDPGSRTVEATSTAQARFSQLVEARAGATTTLEPFKEAAAPITAPPPEPSGRGNTQRTIALAVGGVGAAGLIVGGITGVLAITNKSSAVDVCETKICATQEGVDSWSRATTFGNVSTVGFVVGGVAAAAAIVLYVTAPRSQPKSTATRWDLQGLHF